MFSAETLGLITNCLTEVVWYHRDQERTFRVAGVPQNIRASVPASPFGKPTKRDKAEHIVMGLQALGLDGLGPLRSIVQQLITWKDFDSAADPPRARQLVKTLKEAVVGQDNEREAEQQRIAARRREYERTTQQRAKFASELENLHRQFVDMMSWDDHQRRGIDFQGLLYRLFLLSDLRPKTPFRIVGEEIDGAFVLDNDHFLLEARWREEKTPEADLLVLRGKVESRLEGTRGLFVSVNDYSNEAIQALTQGKKPNIVLIGGAHLNHVLEGGMRLDDMLRELVRIASNTGKVWAPLGSLAG